MNPSRGQFATLISAGLACLLCVPAAAQSSTSVIPGVDGELPWYIGIGQGFYHDTNVYHGPDAKADTYSSTTLFGGFDQQISRQRLHGRGSVSLNRYFDEKQQDNTNYDFMLGLDWQTVASLSGSLNGGIRQHLAYPSPSAGAPTRVLNLEQTDWIDARARWGGTSLLTLEGALRHSSIDYSDESYASRESNGNSGSLTLYYGGGGPLRLGIGGRYDRTETPKAGFDPIVPEFLSNTSTGRHVDFFADYAVTGQVAANLRLSYTEQTNSLVQASDFKGWTGRLAVRWQATGKLSLSAYASRDTGFDSDFSSVSLVPPGSPPGTPPVTALYENNRLTYAADLGLRYSATAKIDIAAGVHYSRAHLVTAANDALGITAVESTDHQKLFYLGANYAFIRNGTASCRLERELRDVTTGNGYSYGSTNVGCQVRFVYRG